MPRVVRGLWIASVVAPVVAVAAACSSELLTSGDFGDEGFTSSSGVSGTTGGPPRPPINAPGFDDLDVPVVACVPPSAADASAADASGIELPDAAADASGDGGSPCAAPPPGQCLGPTEMAELLPGECTAEGTCSFPRQRISCPGGCFRQLDGGHRCNP